MTKLFLLSPARCNGPRADLLLSSPTSAMARQLRARGAPIGEVFAWLSMLYFRGKLAYAGRFAPAGGALVMAPGAGLVPPAAPLTADDLRAMGRIEVDTEAFVGPLRRDAGEVRRVLGDVDVVLLGSIATGKYVDTLLDVFGGRLLFPEAFVGRGDNSRGGLLLRAARSGEELGYVPVEGAARRGPRPPRLPKLVSGRR